ncbi:MAG TPA: hypothetical protein VMR62_17315 [Bryobacteraceae bacterium]|nr:hypothetical protein [Bryobacteraceae bacterium]
MKRHRANQYAGALCLAVVASWSFLPSRTRAPRAVHRSYQSLDRYNTGRPDLIKAAFQQDSAAGSSSDVAPVINYFNVAPASTLPGQAAIATISVSNVTAATINGIIASCSGGICAGTMLFYPGSTTNYVLDATGTGGNMSASQQVEVGKYQRNPAASPTGLQVTWNGACWLKGYPKSFCNGACQGMDFTVAIPNPPSQLPLEGTLYLGSTTCNPSEQDNLNDFGSPTGSGGWIFWFTHHPNRKKSSAIWTFGNQSSGCVSYANAPDCP